VRAGKDIFIAQARDFMTTRMYGSLREIVAGWSKNLASGAPLMAPPNRRRSRGWFRTCCGYRRSSGWPAILWLANGRQWAAVATFVSLLTWIVVYAHERAPVLVCAALSASAQPFVALIMMRSAWRGRRLIEWRAGVIGPRIQRRHEDAVSAEPPSDQK